MEDLHKRWAHRWITSKAEAFDSGIHGVGVRAVEDISEGENIVVFGGIVVPTMEIKEYWKILGHIGIQISEDFSIVPSTREEVNVGGVFNHSCDPNCGFSNCITLVAIKNISIGEELFFDYAFSETYGEVFDCSCESKNCRGKITPDDWKLKDLQEKQGKYFSPYVREKVLKS